MKQQWTQDRQGFWGGRALECGPQGRCSKAMHMDARWKVLFVFPGRLLRRMEDFGGWDSGIGASCHFLVLE